MYLLDTNVLSEFYRDTPHANVQRRFREEQAVVATAAPVLHEITHGYLRLPIGRRRREFERITQEIIQGMVVLSYDAETAQWHAAERARLTRLGRTPPYPDGQIAAIAAVNGLILVTANVRDFADYDGLTVEDWRI